MSPTTAADPALRDSFLGLLRSLAAAHGLDPDELEQQVWLRAAAEPLQSHPRSRLRALTVQEFRTAVTAAEGLSRERDAAESLAAALLEAAEVSPEHLFIAAEEARALRAAVARLPSRCPSLVEALLEAPPLSYRELAEELEIPRGSIGPTRSRCLACLRRLLGAGRTAAVPPVDPSRVPPQLRRY